MTSEKSKMKIVVIGGTGLIGSKVVKNLRERGYEAVAASPNSGVNTLTGEGLAEVLERASVVVDVSNSPSFEDAPVMEFFKTSTGNMLSYEAAAGVGHHVALSIVGTDRLPDSGYLRAKVVQEKLIQESSIPYSIVRATQFFEFFGRIADSATEGNTVRLPSVSFQPMAADDVARVVSEVAMASPLNGTVEVGGPGVQRQGPGLRGRLPPGDSYEECQRQRFARLLRDLNGLFRCLGGSLGRYRSRRQHQQHGAQRCHAAQR